MNATEIIAGLPAYTGNLKKSIEVALNYLREEAVHAIPSFELGGDGPLLRSVFIFTESYLCEVRARKNIRFDIVDRIRCDNIRFRIYTADIKDGEGQVIKTYEAVDVEVRHNIGGTFLSEIAYVGDSRDDWLKRLYEALPVNIILR